MRLWNLAKFADLEDQILGVYAKPEDMVRPRPPVHRSPRIRLMLSVAALVTLTISVPKANSNELSVPLTEMGVAQSVAEARPPLERFFEDRYDDSWTPESEERMLLDVESRRLGASPEALFEQIVDSVFSNQQEQLSMEQPVLSRGDVARIVRRAKGTR